MSNQARMVAEEVTDAFMELSIARSMLDLDAKWFHRYPSIEFELAMGDLGGLNSVCTGRVKVWYSTYSEEVVPRLMGNRKPEIEIKRVEQKWGDDTNWGESCNVVHLQPDAEEFVRQEILRGDE